MRVIQVAACSKMKDDYDGCKLEVAAGLLGLEGPVLSRIVWASDL